MLLFLAYYAVLVHKGVYKPNVVKPLPPSYVQTPINGPKFRLRTLQT